MQALNTSGFSCLFAHFNPNNGVCEHVYTFLDHLLSLNIRIVFISNSPVREKDRLRLKNAGVYKIVERENKGNDFGAWQFAIRNSLIPDDTEHLLLTNDSIFGPFWDLAPIIREMSEQPVDFWGLTDSLQGEWHIQSYFVSLSKKVFTSTAFSKVFSGNFSGFQKKEIIEKGEIFLTTELVRNGFSAAVRYPYQQLDPDCMPTSAYNPTHHFFAELIVSHRFPFLKKELVLQNPENLPGVHDILDYISQNSDYHLGNIKNTLIDAFQTEAADKPNRPAISVLCHIYYPTSIYYFLLRISALRSYNSTFIFNLSSALFYNEFFMDVLKTAFPEAILLHSPAKGRDIGGKMVAIDALLRLDTPSDYSLIIHDKLSPHAPTGKEWRDTLFKIIARDRLPEVMNTFDQKPKVGAITEGNFIKNEYDPDKEGFTCTSNENLLSYISQYDLNLSSYNFAAGTIFWIRTTILKEFFGRHTPLSIRETLESGNALDFNKGTNIHAWERLFTLIADAMGYKVTGI